MTTKITAWAILVGGLVIGLSVPAMAEIIQTKDSAEFEHFYEGGPPTISGVAAELDLENSGYYTSDIEDTVLTSEQGVLAHEAALTNVYDAMFYNSLWESEADRVGGWTWEMKFKMDANNSPSSGTVLQMRIGDCDSGNQMILQFRNSQIYAYGQGEIIARDFTDRFHTLRIAQDAGSGVSEIWVDDVPAKSITGKLDNDVHWLNGGGATIGGTTYIDYIRWTGQGGYAPVPEPAMLVLLLTGGAAVMARRRFRRR